MRVAIPDRLQDTIVAKDFKPNQTLLLATPTKTAPHEALRIIKVAPVPLLFADGQLVEAARPLLLDDANVGLGTVGLELRARRQVV